MSPFEFQGKTAARETSGTKVQRNFTIPFGHGFDLFIPDYTSLFKDNCAACFSFVRSSLDHGEGRAASAESRDNHPQDRIAAVSDIFVDPFLKGFARFLCHCNHNAFLT